MSLKNFAENLTIQFKNVSMTVNIATDTQVT